MAVHTTQYGPGNGLHGGFTLIEMLVVVAVLALLLSLLVPSLQTARKMAERAPCQANLKDMSAGLIAYTAANRQVLPPKYANMRPSRTNWQTGEVIHAWSSGSWEWCWREFIQPYCDPSAKPVQTGPICVGWPPRDGVYDRWTADPDPTNYRSLIYSKKMDCPTQKNQEWVCPQTQEEQPSGEYSMTVGGWNAYWWFGHPENDPPPRARSYGTAMWDYRPQLITQYTAEKLIGIMEPTWYYASFPGCNDGYPMSLIRFMPHMASSNAAFVDGHVEVISEKMVWNYIEEQRPYRFPFCQPLGTY